MAASAAIDMASRWTADRPCCRGWPAARFAVAKSLLHLLPGDPHTRSSLARR
jgi:hypothetical protein